MKIQYTYNFSKDEKVTIELDEEWNEILVDLDRQDYNSWHKLSRHTCALEALEATDSYDPEENGPLEAFIRQEDTSRVWAAIHSLKPDLQELIVALFIQGMSGKDYAARKGVSPAAITQKKATALKHLKKYFLVKP